DSANSGDPVWSPDSKRIVFISNRAGGGPLELFVKPADGSGPDAPLYKSLYPTSPEQWSADGKWILFAAAGGVQALPLEGDRKPIVVVENALLAGEPQLSPDSKWLAYTSLQTGRPEIYVQSFPAVTAKWQVSSGGGEKVRWRGDGREIYYVGGG